MPPYEGVPLFPEVDAFMRSLGFQLYDVSNYFCQRQIPWLPKSDVIIWRLVHLTDRLFPSLGWASKSKADLGSRYGTR